MGLDLSSLNSHATAAPAPAPAPVAAPAPEASGRIVLDLSKNTKLDLTKRAPSLSKVLIGAGWDVARAGATTCDLDLFALCLNADGNVSSVDNIIFFNNMSRPGIRLDGDNRTGDGEGDDEKIHISLNEIPADVMSIVICIDIYDAVNKQQTFGMIENAYVRAVDEGNGGTELCIFPLTADYSASTAIIAAKLDREGSSWTFNAVGEGLIGDINSIAERYM